MALVLAFFVLVILFAGLGVAVHFLWIIAVVLFFLWIIGFFIRGIEGSRRGWYGRRW
ncbi:MAG: hydrophobic protein [Acidimicrobiales bacterium]